MVPVGSLVQVKEALRMPMRSVFTFDVVSDGGVLGVWIKLVKEFGLAKEVVQTIERDLGLDHHGNAAKDHPHLVTQHVEN
jgi:hypothetical protein